MARPRSRTQPFARTLLVLVLMPTLVFGQVPSPPGGSSIPQAAQETLDALQETPGLQINTGKECCKPSIWDFLGVHQVHDHIHGTLQTIADLPLVKNLMSTMIMPGLQMVGLAPPPEGGLPLPGAEGAAGADGAGGPGGPGGPGAPGAGGPGGAGGAGAGAVAQKIAADQKAADAKVATLEFLGQQNCNDYPEVIPAILAELDDPNERVRYAALIALQRLCEDLRCSTLTGTRIAYHLRGEEFIAHCRQCTSCACQDDVIKRLSDLLLDKTALGNPKENSPRVRQLAAAILDNCMRLHPPDPQAPPKPREVQPDPVPAPIPDPEGPQAGSRRKWRFLWSSQGPRLFPSRSEGWLTRLVPFRRAWEPERDRPRYTVYRGAEPDGVFDWGTFADAGEDFGQWRDVAPSAAEPAVPTEELGSATAPMAPDDDGVPLPPLDSSAAPVFELGAGTHVDAPPTRAPTSEQLFPPPRRTRGPMFFSPSQRTPPASDVRPEGVRPASHSGVIRAVVPSPAPQVTEDPVEVGRRRLSAAEAQVRATFPEDAQSWTSAFEAAVEELCEARLQLALLGDATQFEQLYEDAETLCQRMPNTPMAGSAMDAIARYYLARDQAHPDDSTWLRKYAGCLRYRVARFDAYPAETPQLLYEASISLLDLGIEADAEACLRTITAKCGGTPIADSAAQRLHELKTAPPAPEPLLAESVAAPTPAAESAPTPAASAPVETPASPGPEPSSETVEFVIPQRIVPTPPHPGRVLGASALAQAQPRGVTRADASEPQPTPANAPTPARIDPAAVAQSQPALQAGLEIMPAPPAEGLEAPPVPGPIPDEPLPPLEPVADPFGPTPLDVDIYERARTALEADAYADFHLQPDDNIIEPFNNTVGIKIAPYALHHIYSAQPGNIFRVRFESVYGYDRPDRSEYFWQQEGGGGPNKIEKGLNYQQIYIYNETGSDKVSAFAEYPIYLLNPQENSNTTGPGDFIVGAKTVMIDDENWKVTSLMRTYTPVGKPQRGLGRGHLALEPGVAVLWRVGRQTNLHADLRFHFPIGADPKFGGEVLTGGIGFSRVLWSDPLAPPTGRSYAAILTAETVFTSFLDGLVTNPKLAAPEDAELTSIIQNIGLRSVWTKRFSTGYSIGFPLSTSHLYDFSMLIDFQWVH